MSGAHQRAKAISLGPDAYAAYKRKETLKKRAERARKSGRTGLDVFRLPGHPTGCRCYDCLFPETRYPELIQRPSALRVCRALMR